MVEFQIGNEIQKIVYQFEYCEQYYFAVLTDRYYNASALGLTCALQINCPFYWCNTARPVTLLKERSGVNRCNF